VGRVGCTRSMAPLVYLETSIISYLTAWPSRDLIVAADSSLERLTKPVAAQRAGRI
jgi:hypothetical protein